MWQWAESRVFRRLNFSNTRWEKIIEALLQRFEDNYLEIWRNINPITIARLQRGGCVRRSNKATKQGFIALNWSDDLDGGPYSYLDLKSDPYQIFSSIYRVC